LFQFENLACLALSYTVDLGVDDGHNDQRQVERSHRRNDGVCAVDVQGAIDVRYDGGRRVVVHRRLDVGGEPPGVDRPERNGQATRPDGPDDRQSSAPRDSTGVGQRLGDRQVALDGDDAQVQDRRRAARHVARYPEVAERPSEPLSPSAAGEPNGIDGRPAFEFEERRVGHDEKGDGQVGDGERHDEIVGDRTQPMVAEDGGDDQPVADQRGRYYDTHRRSNKHDDEQVELTPTSDRCSTRIFVGVVRERRRLVETDGDVTSRFEAYVVIHLGDLRKTLRR